MTFDARNITTLGGQLKRGLQSLGYTSSTDTVTEVTADGYFNDYREYITKGDIILFIELLTTGVDMLAGLPATGIWRENTSVT